MGRRLVVDLDMEQESLYEKLQKTEKLVFTHNGRKITFLESGTRGAWQSYPKIKIYAQNIGISLRELSVMLETNYQGFVNACNGRSKFKDEWKPVLAGVLGASEKELFG